MEVRRSAAWRLCARTILGLRLMIRAPKLVSKRIRLS